MNRKFAINMKNARARVDLAREERVRIYRAMKEAYWVRKFGDDPAYRAQATAEMFAIRAARIAARDELESARAELAELEAVYLSLTHTASTWV